MRTDTPSNYVRNTSGAVGKNDSPIWKVITMQERRERQRFSFQQPALLRFCAEDIWRETRGVVENASEMGALLVTGSEVSRGIEAEVTIEMPHEVLVSAPSRVVRVEGRPDGKLAIAVQCQSAFSERRGTAVVAPTLTLAVEGPVAGNSFIIRCKGRLAREGADALRERVLQLFATTSRIVVDLKNVEHMDSLGLGILAGLFTSAKRRGGEVKLVSPTQHAKLVLRRTQLDTVFKVYETDADAVAAFSFTPHLETSS